VATVKNSEKETSTVEKCSAMRYAMNMYASFGRVYVYLYLAVGVFACVSGTGKYSQHWHLPACCSSLH